MKNHFCLAWLYNCCHCKALILAHLLDTKYIMFRPIENFLEAREVQKLVKNHTFTHVFVAKICYESMRKCPILTNFWTSRASEKFSMSQNVTY